jgi:uncharacterized protein
MSSSVYSNDALLGGATASEAQIAQPVRDRERIVSIDVLRGFALLGILLMNIQSFSMIDAAYSNPTAYGDLHGLNYLVWLLCHLFVDYKMMSIFSMLFGAGVYLMTSHVEASGGKSAGLHYRRMGWLILFGLLHGFLLWDGDILTDYGLCGLLIYSFRKRAPKALLILGALTLTGAPLLMVLFSSSLTHMPADRQQISRENLWQPTPEQIARQNANYRGSWRMQMRERAPAAALAKTLLFLFVNFWREAGLMLIGIALLKLGVFSARRPAWEYAVMVASGALIGLPLVGYGVYRMLAAHWAFPYSFVMDAQCNYVGSLFVCFGWVGAVMLACQSAALLPATRRLAAVGRMAFSNYIFHTLVCTTLFYGHGLGLYGKVERTGQLAIVLAIWAFQLALSPVWLHHFYFGPLEWLWRSLTYWQLEPFRRQRAVAVA